ncbi:zinc finger MYM-type protein 6-like [Centruroides vittatus]|uniref:zinc finger MYM-type protein 6-like n=1 Tax=Centruroides vittatus TaxID=120091 RepID=UPI00350F0A83
MPFFYAMSDIDYEVNDVKQELLCCLELESHTTSTEIYKAVNNYIENNSIVWKNCVGVCTNGAACMTGLQGNNTTIFNLYSKIDAFKNKLILWNEQIQEDNYDMFHSLSDFINSGDLDIKYINHIVWKHLQALSCAFNEYYPRIGYMWIINPFVGQQTNRLNDFELEKLIELSSDLELKALFESMPITQFWIKVKTEYPLLHEKAVRMLLPFSTTYLCKSTFSATAMIKSKQRNHLSVSSALSLAVTTLNPQIDDLTRKKDQQKAAITLICTLMYW